MSEIWKRKLRTYFWIFDFDKDGVISKDHWVGMASRFFSFGLPDKEKAEQLKICFEQVRFKAI